MSTKRAFGAGAVAALVAGATAAGLVQYAFAGGSQSGPPPPASAASSVTTRDYVAPKLKYKGTFAAAGENSPVLTMNTYNPIHAPIPIKCSKACLVVAHESAQVYSGAAGTSWAMCAAWEGNVFLEPSCPYASGPNALGQFDTRAFTQTAHLAKGDHTVVLTIYPDHAGSAVARWSVQFDVYTT